MEARRSGERAAPSLAGRAVAIFVGVLLALPVVELALAALELPDPGVEFVSPEARGSGAFEPDDELFWRLRPDLGPPEFNRRGLRGSWREGPKRANELRLAFVGDSCTFGTGVRLEDVYGVVLERLLARRFPERDVSSALLALPGYSSFQSVRLFDRLAPELRPDWTVIYVGAWNDAVPALGVPDAERAADRARPRVARVLAPQEVAEAGVAQHLAAFARGAHLSGPRVPLDAFRENLRRLVARARETGRAVLVVPPLPEETRARTPLGEPYRAAIRAVAAELEVPLVDAQHHFEEAVGDLDESWREIPRGKGSLLFTDWVHPSALGHRWLAKALFEVVVAGGETRTPLAGSTTDAAPLPRTVGLEPVEVDAHHSGLLRFDLDQPRRVTAAWIGDQCALAVEQPGSTALARTAERPGSRELVLTPPRVLRPGVHDLELRTPDGLVVAPGAVRVRPHPLSVVLEVAQEPATMTITLTGPPGWIAGVWFATERRDPPLATGFGALRLALPNPARPHGRPDLPVRFDRIPFTYTGLLDRDGRWSRTLELPPGALDTTTYLQGAILDGARPKNGAMSELVEVALP